MHNCQRCYEETFAVIMSVFNVELICMDCSAKERDHPKYAAAVKAEAEACRRGDYNFPGIGKPGDL